MKTRRELFFMLYFKIEHTECIYKMMQNKFSELENGNPSLTWEGMWVYYDSLKDEYPDLNDETLLLPYHLLQNLQTVGHHVFFKQPESYWDKPFIH